MCRIFAISICYYWMFQQLPETRWRLGKKRLLDFFAIMGLVFLILSPTILLPETWKHWVCLPAASVSVTTVTSS